MESNWKAYGICVSDGSGILLQKCSGAKDTADSATAAQCNEAGGTPNY